MKIIIESIPHSQQKYPTVGDWKVEPDGTWHILVSEMSDWRYMLLVGRHELDEMAICQHRGIKEEDVSAFDIRFEEERERGLHTPEEEPGDSPDAPYREPHFIATNAERELSVPLQVDFLKYDKEVVSL
jgi:hypothetical protein